MENVSPAVMVIAKLPYGKMAAVGKNSRAYLLPLLQGTQPAVDCPQKQE